MNRGEVTVGRVRDEVTVELIRATLAALVEALGGSGRRTTAELAEAWAEACLHAGCYCSPYLDTVPRRATNDEAEQLAELLAAKDAAEVIEHALRAAWQVLYPEDDGDGWEYPGQVASHSRVILAELREQLAGAQAELARVRCKLDAANHADDPPYVPRAPFVDPPGPFVRMVPAEELDKMRAAANADHEEARRLRSLVEQLEATAKREADGMLELRRRFGAPPILGVAEWIESLDAQLAEVRAARADAEQVRDAALARVRTLDVEAMQTAAVLAEVRKDRDEAIRLLAADRLARPAPKGGAA